MAKVSELEINIRTTGDAAAKSIKSLSSAFSGLTASSKKMTGVLGGVASSLQRIAFYRVIRTVIKSIGQAFDEGSKNAYHFADAVGYYVADALDALATKNFTATNQLGAAWATLLATITPILIQIINLITAVANAITQLFALLGGKSTYMKAIDYTKKWADTTKGGAAAAKEWKNQLMGFDEINRLNEPSAGGGGGGGGAPDYGSMFEITPISSKITNIVDTIKAHLLDLQLFASGALLGLGLLLTFTGANIPLGLGLIAAGAYMLCRALSENWGYITENLRQALSSVSMIAAGALFGIGALMAFSGANVPLGIALMAAGALAFANNIALNWNILPNKIKSKIKTIDAILGVSLLGVGAILTFSGANLPLGIALMATGAASLAAAVALSWDYLEGQISNVVAGIAVVVGGALIAVGAILAFSGVNIPLGIGLLMAGITSAGIGVAMAVDWNSLADNVCSGISKIVGWVQSLFGWARNATEQLNEMFKASTFSQSLGNGRTFSYNGLRGGVFAEGGFPTEGQIFVAREAGAELVGQIGGRTAVANNDQIVESVSDGVYRAVTEALLTHGSNSNGNQEIVINVDGNTLARTMTKYQRFNTIAANA